MAKLTRTPRIPENRNFGQEDYKCRRKTKRRLRFKS